MSNFYESITMLYQKTDNVSKINYVFKHKLKDISVNQGGYYKIINLESKQMGNNCTLKVKKHVIYGYNIPQFSD